MLFAILLFFELVSNIEQVKLLNNDPCRLCENMTGGTCLNMGDTKLIEKPVYINKNFNETMIKNYINQTK